MKHVVQHSNDIVTVKIEVEGDLAALAVSEIMVKVDELIGLAKAANATYHLYLHRWSDFNKKIPIIRTVRNALATGLKEAKELVERAPTVVMQGSRSKLEPVYRELLELSADVRLYNDQEIIALNVMEG